MSPSIKAIGSLSGHQLDGLLRANESRPIKCYVFWAEGEVRDLHPGYYEFMWDGNNMAYRSARTPLRNMIQFENWENFRAITNQGERIVFVNYWFAIAHYWKIGGKGDPFHGKGSN